MKGLIPVDERSVSNLSNAHKEEIASPRGQSAAQLQIFTAPDPKLSAEVFLDYVLSGVEWHAVIYEYGRIMWSIQNHWTDVAKPNCLPILRNGPRLAQLEARF